MTSELKSSTAYTDFNGLATLRTKARNTPDGALREVAQQFEALFMNMMLKSMRDASMGDPLFDSNESGMYRDLLDNQLAINMSAQQGIGIADAIVSQLGHHATRNETEVANIGLKRQVIPGFRVENVPSNLPLSSPPEANAASAYSRRMPERFESPEHFIESLWPEAVTAAKELGTDPRALIAQAALETGWGKKVIAHTDGRSTFNLFNIKADRRWDGENATVGTLEYQGGLPVRKFDAFRSYDSWQDSFADYVDFLKKSPRYAKAMETGGDGGRFIEELHKAGYATDPEYGNKIKDIMSRNVVLGMGVENLKISARGDDMKLDIQIMQP